MPVEFSQSSEALAELMCAYDGKLVFKGYKSNLTMIKVKQYTTDI